VEEAATDSIHRSSWNLGIQKIGVVISKAVVFRRDMFLFMGLIFLQVLQSPQKRWKTYIIQHIGWKSGFAEDNFIFQKHTEHVSIVTSMILH